MDGSISFHAVQRFTYPVLCSEVGALGMQVADHVAMPLGCSVVRRRVLVLQSRGRWIHHAE